MQLYLLLSVIWSLFLSLEAYGAHCDLSAERQLQSTTEAIDLKTNHAIKAAQAARRYEIHNIKIHAKAARASLTSKYRSLLRKVTRRYNERIARIQAQLTRLIHLKQLSLHGKHHAIKHSLVNSEYKQRLATNAIEKYDRIHSRILKLQQILKAQFATAQHDFEILKDKYKTAYHSKVLYIQESHARKINFIKTKYIGRLKTLKLNLKQAIGSIQHDYIGKLKRAKILELNEVELAKRISSAALESANRRNYAALSGIRESRDHRLEVARKQKGLDLISFRKRISLDMRLRIRKYERALKQSELKYNRALITLNGLTLSLNRRKALLLKSQGRIDLSIDQNHRETEHLIQIADKRLQKKILQIEKAIKYLQGQTLKETESLVGKIQEAKALLNHRLEVIDHESNEKLSQLAKVAAIRKNQEKIYETKLKKKSILRFNSVIKNAKIEEANVISAAKRNQLRDNSLIEETNSLLLP